MQSGNIGEVVRKENQNYFSKYKDYICIAIIGLSVGIAGYAGLMSVPRAVSQTAIEEKKTDPHRLLTNPQEWLERRKERLQKEKGKLTGDGKPYDGDAYEAKR